MNKKDEIIQQFCLLSNKVMRFKEYYEAADCFCIQSEGSSIESFRFSPKILEFIEEAVDISIAINFRLR